MRAADARAVALSAHVGQVTLLGEPLVSHLERVAARVPSAAVATAWLHELGERGATSVHDLLTRGITPAELGALELLTFTEGEDYRLYVRRIARAPGEAGSLARAVKLAELDDDLARLPASARSRRGFHWARQEIARGQRRTRRQSGERQDEAA
jgi:hypothetical protein